MKKIIYVAGLFLLLGNVSNSQVPVPADPQSNPILLLGATAHIGDGTVIENAAIGFENGKITLVANASNTTINQSGYEVYDVKGKHVYPGFILPNTQLGLIEVSSIRAMSDQSERGEINPNVRSLISYNTDSEMPPTMRFNGILLAEATPTGGLIAGSSSVMEMDGWNWEDAAHTIDLAMHMDWPSKMRRQFNFASFSVSEQPNPDYDQEVNDLEKHFTDAKSYATLKEKETNLKLEAMQGLFDGSQILMIHTSSAKEVVESINFAKDKGVKRIALVGGEEALFVADFLSENDIPVILPPVHSLPSRPDYDINLPYKMPHLLSEAGVTVALSHSGMLANARNLPFYAGTAAAWGMEKEEALKCITSNTAKILGIDDRVGTLEEGKDATLFVSEGDALDFRTNILRHVFISGKKITLDNKQQELYERFSRKYGQME